MEILQFVAVQGEERFEITCGGGWGSTVYRYVQGRNTHDYLQADTSEAMGCAETEWGVPPTAWRRASPGELPLWEKNI